MESKSKGDQLNEKQQQLLEIAKKFSQEKGSWLLYSEEHYGEAIMLIPYLSIVKKQKIALANHPFDPFVRSNISYINLRYLSLACCKMKNIECLVKLNAPELLGLNLNDNQIKEGRSLRKCFFPKLKSLILINNHIIELDWIEELNTSSESLTLQLEEFDCEEICSSLNFIAKIKKSPLMIYCESQKRIKQKKMYEILKERKSILQKRLVFHVYKNYGAM